MRGFPSVGRAMDAKRTRGLIKLGVVSLFCATVAWAADHAVFSSVFLALGAVAAFGAAVPKTTALKWEASMAVSFINDPEHC
jgi:hypothetical protein